MVLFTSCVQVSLKLPVKIASVMVTIPYQEQIAGFPSRRFCKLPPDKWPRSSMDRNNGRVHAITTLAFDHIVPSPIVRHPAVIDSPTVAADIPSVVHMLSLSSSRIGSIPDGISIPTDISTAAPSLLTIDLCCAQYQIRGRDISRNAAVPAGLPPLPIRICTVAVTLFSRAEMATRPSTQKKKAATTMSMDYKLFSSPIRLHEGPSTACSERLAMPVATIVVPAATPLLTTPRESGHSTSVVPVAVARDTREKMMYFRANFEMMGHESDPLRFLQQITSVLCNRRTNENDKEVQNSGAILRLWQTVAPAFGLKL
jgi:hypothetical protein